MLKSQLEYADINDIFDSGLHEYLDNFQKKLNEVSTAIFEIFFSIENIINKNKYIKIMTYCLGIKVKSGFVGISDTRITSGMKQPEQKKYLQLIKIIILFLL